MWCGVAFGQTQSITGTVVGAEDSARVPWAKVLWNGNSQQAVLTDAKGSFTFGGAPVGLCSISAERSGYLATDGQSLIMATVNLEEQKKPEPVVMRLIPSATIAGSVTDENGFPLPFPNVSLIRRVVVNGRAKFVQMGQSSGADDLGGRRAQAGVFYRARRRDECERLRQ